MFHAKDGWFFNRREDGSVEIRHNPSTQPNVNESALVTFDANSWASIVSSVSAKGEEDGRYYTALAFHNE